MIYLDNSATTKPCKAAVAAAVTAMEENFGNPSSLHKLGFNAEKEVTLSRKIIAQALGVNEDEVYFTSGATESNTVAIIGTANAKKRRGNKIITTAIEHHSVLENVESLKKQGFEVVMIYPDKDGNINPKDFADACDEKTILVTCMAVNNETGLILPVNDIISAVKRKNKDVMCHVDAVQAFGKSDSKLAKSGADLISISGHKIYAPKGIGVLYVKKGVRLTPISLGGGQEKGLRPGTESVPLISAFAQAVKENQDNLTQRISLYQELNDYLRGKLSEIQQVTINSHNNAPNILNFSISGIKSEIMLHYLESFDIFISSGSACAKGKKSHVLTAFGLPVQIIDSAIRVSFGKDNTKEELDTFVDVIKKGINKFI